MEATEGSWPECLSHGGKAAESPSVIYLRGHITLVHLNGYGKVSCIEVQK